MPLPPHLAMSGIRSREAIQRHEEFRPRRIGGPPARAGTSQPCDCEFAGRLSRRGHAGGMERRDVDGRRARERRSARGRLCAVPGAARRHGPDDGCGASRAAAFFVSPLALARSRDCGGCGAGVVGLGATAASIRIGRVPGGVQTQAAPVAEPPAYVAEPGGRAATQPGRGTTPRARAVTPPARPRAAGACRGAAACRGAVGREARARFDPGRTPARSE